MPDVVSLAEIAIGLQTRIVRIDSSVGLHFSKLAAFGLLPGTEVVVLQKEPAVVIAVDHTYVALDKRLAHTIIVERKSCR